MKKIILIGSRGFIGRYINLELIRNRNFIIYEGYKEKINICKKRSFETALNKIKPDYIINTAAFSHLDPIPNSEIFKINCNAVIDMIEILEKIKFQGKFINTSSALIYGNSSKRKISETDNYNSKYVYAIAKAAVDSIIDELDSELNIISARPFNCIGVGHRNNYLVPKIIHHFKNKKKSITLGNINSNRDYIDVRDVARMYYKIMLTKKKLRSYNLCSGKSYSAKDIIRIVEGITGHNITIVSQKKLLRSIDNDNICGNNSRIKSLGFNYKFNINATLAWMIKN